jgi:hypothetical protein
LASSIKPPLASGGLYPGTGSTRPGSGDRPSLGTITRPGGGGATQLPVGPGSGGIGGSGGSGIRPGGGGGGIQWPGGDRPGGGGGIAGGGNRPGGGGIAGGGDRPGGGVGPNRPGDGIGPSRPGQGGGGTQWRPGDNRPGGGGNRPDRPIIGGGGNRPGRPGGGNNNIIGGGNSNFIGGGNNIIHGGNNWGNWGVHNRPGGDRWSQHHDWDHWHNNWNNNINHYHNWYHGAWNNHWGNGWYAPVAWGAVGWGLGSLYGGGYYGGSSYYNPYYDAAALVPYDYSQPVVVNNYVPVDTALASVGTAPPASAPVSAQVTTAFPPPSAVALAHFDEGLAAFKAGNYQASIAEFDSALKQLPSDPVVHEVRALALFAVGDYKAAAASLNSLLAAAPGMDWTTMAGLYGDANDYTNQLRTLEQHCKTNPNDASAFFVIAYHYLVTGSQDAAIRALKIVVREQPKDLTARRMLDSLQPAETAATATASATSLPPPPPASGGSSSADSEPQTDLVGTWRAKAGDAAIDLTIDDDSQFTWKATIPNQPPIELKGELAVNDDSIILDTKDQGSMVGRVVSNGPDKWLFAINGSPPNDPGINFQRAK